MYVDSIKKQISTRDLFPVIEEVIGQGYQVKFTISGNSMRPWLVDNRDQVLISSIRGRRLRRGDIILYRNQQENYILHRIHRQVQKGYRTIGDACRYEDEMIVRKDNIIGIVDKIYRKGKVIRCSSLFSIFQFTIWRLTLPIRDDLLWMYYSLMRLRSKK